MHLAMHVHSDTHWGLIDLSNRITLEHVPPGQTGSTLPIKRSSAVAPGKCTPFRDLPRASTPAEAANCLRNWRTNVNHSCSAHWWGTRSELIGSSNREDV